VIHVIETVTALDAETVVIGRAIAAVHMQDSVVLYVIRELAADAAKGTYRMHLLVGFDHADVTRRHQSAGRACLHAFTASDASRLTHSIVKVEHDFGTFAAERVTDDVVDLNLAASTHATRALNA
jgi:hypothetical protein